MSSSDKLPPLTVSENSLTTYNDWLAWKRSLIYYLEAKAITDQARRKAILLHKGGRQLQDIYATIESADPKAKPPENPFEAAMEQLDRHFKPTTNRCYERFLFRQIKQGSDSIEQFVVKLKKQAANCKFAAVDEAICDQIIDGTSNMVYRRKILEQRLDKLQPIIDLGKLLESVHLQTSSMSIESSSSHTPVVSDSVARVTNRGNHREPLEQPSTSFRRRCFRCGSSNHEGSSPSCPAKDATCYRCDKKGHFASRCRTRQREGDGAASRSSAENSKSVDRQRVRTLDKKDDSSSDDGNVFQVKATQLDAEGGASSNRVTLRFGELVINPVIDSGADVNLLAPETWKILRRRHPELQRAEVDCCIYPYGRKAPLQFQTAVIVPVKSKSASISAKFLVLTEDEGDYETIVGRELAVQLGVLKIGDKVADVRHLCIANPNRPKLGKLVGVQLNLPLDNSVRPVAQPCRRVPFALRKVIAEHIESLILDDVIEPVDGEPTEWVSPIVPVIKKNGEMRLCIDMRMANTAVLREKYPIPTFEELITEMTDCEFFSRIDLRSAYHQVELTPKSRKITTFITPGGIYRFKRLYCGIKCAPEIFQKLMTQVLHGLQNVQVFFDDIVIFSKTKSAHEKHVKAVLDCLRQRGLSINLNKSTFGATAINFLGHRLSKNCIKPNETNAEAIRNFKPPSNKKDLQSFLGLMNFVARFIPDFSSVAAPLRKLLPAAVKFKWSTEHSVIFEKLKKLVQNVSLGILDSNARIQIYADASPVGLGAVLLQLRPGKTSPDILGFASRSLSKAEQNYSQIEREALGLVWACERFRMYTLGKQFDLFTDHKPLEILFAPKSKPNARIERWVLRLQNFDFTVKYIQGNKNIADSFSRLGCIEPNAKSYTETVTSTVYQLTLWAVPKAISIDEFRLESQKDAELSELRSALQRDVQLPSPYLRFKYELAVIDDLVLRGDRLIPPRNLRERILNQAHEGHPGIESMKRRLRSKVWWPGIDAAAEKLVKNCHSCLAVSRYNPPQPMRRSAIPSTPWEFVAIDFLGPLPDGRFILVVIDYFSRFMECAFTKSTSTIEVIRQLSQIFARFGYPVRLKSDNATSFTSVDFKNFLEEYGVTHVTSPPLWPQANGEVERQNRSILKRLQIAAVESKDLVIELSKYLLLYHGTPHSTTGRTPAELMLNRKLRDKIPSIFTPSVLCEEVKDTDSLAKEKGKEYADSRRHAERRQIEVGDKVLLPANRSNKLSPAFDPSPFTVVESSPNEVRVQRGSQVFRRSLSAVKPLPKEGSPPETNVASSSSEVPASEPPMEWDTSPVADAVSPAAESLLSPQPPRSRSGRLLKPVQRLDL